MKVDRTQARETSKNHQAIKWNPQGRGEEVGHKTPGRDTEGKQEMVYTRRERWRGWPWTKNVPWSMAYAPSEQTGRSK